MSSLKSWTGSGTISTRCLETKCVLQDNQRSEIHFLAEIHGEIFLLNEIVLFATFGRQKPQLKKSLLGFLTIGFLNYRKSCFTPYKRGLLTKIFTWNNIWWTELDHLLVPSQEKFVLAIGFWSWIRNPKKTTLKDCLWWKETFFVLPSDKEW